MFFSRPFFVLTICITALFMEPNEAQADDNIHLCNRAFGEMRQPLYYYRVTGSRNGGSGWSGGRIGGWYKLPARECWNSGKVKDGVPFAFAFAMQNAAGELVPVKVRPSQNFGRVGERVSEICAPKTLQDRGSYNTLGDGDCSEKAALFPVSFIAKTKIRTFATSSVGKVTIAVVSDTPSVDLPVSDEANARADANAAAGAFVLTGDLAFLNLDRLKTFYNQCYAVLQAKRSDPDTNQFYCTCNSYVVEKHLAHVSLDDLMTNASDTQLFFNGIMKEEFFRLSNYETRHGLLDDFPKCSYSSTRRDVRWSYGRAGDPKGPVAELLKVLPNF